MADRDQEQPERFTDLYAKYLAEVIKPTERRVREVFKEWRTPGYWVAHGEGDGVAVPRPVQRVRIRVKRPESLLDKFELLKDEFPDGPTAESLPRMRDILGARIVTYFLG